MVQNNRRSIDASLLVTQPVSVTRQMAAAFPRLKRLADDKGMKLHHLGAGYPHPEISDPAQYISQKQRYLRHLAQADDADDTDSALRTLMIQLYGYGDTLGPPGARQAFAHVYGNDFGFEIDPDLVIPTVGATGGIDLMCSLFERSGEDIAYIVDAPTYTGFVSRARLYQKASFYSVLMDEEGPQVSGFAKQIDNARADGKHVAFYYTVPDGHNPGGISFSQARRDEIMRIAQCEGIIIVEDAPYTYISFEDPGLRPSPFVAMDSDYAVHLFTGSKIGLPGPRVGFAYSTAMLNVASGPKSLKDLLLTEASGAMLFHNPESLRAFEAYLTDDNNQLRSSLWGVAEAKQNVYRENREILLSGLDQYLGDFPDHFAWSKPGAGFFSVFTFKKGNIQTDQQFVEKLIADYGVITIPMYGFYPDDARASDPDVGLNQLRLAFSYTVGVGEQRRQDMREAVRAFSHAVRVESGLPPLDDDKNC